MGVRFWSMTEGETRKEKAKLSEIFLSSFNDSCNDWDDINVKHRTSTPEAQANTASPAGLMSVNIEAANATTSLPTQYRMALTLGLEP